MKEYTIKINGNDYAVIIKNVDNNVATVKVNDTSYEVEVSGLTVKSQPKIATPAPAIPTTTPPAGMARPAATASVAAGDIKSPLPGVVLDLMVREGDTVKAGQKLMVLEAMKMENNIDSDRDGVVKSIRAHKGDSVLEGDVLMTIG